MQNNKYKFLNDRPVKKDAIGHYEIIANQLYETIHCNLEKPFVIGLFGSWGTGKSSIIEMLKNRCEDKNTKVIVVDAWRKDKSIFNRQFMKKIAKELLNTKKYDNLKETIDKKISTSENAWKPTKIAWTLFLLFLGLFAMCVCVAVWGWWKNIVTSNPNPFPYASILGPIVGILIACYFQFLLPRFSIKTDTKTEDVSIHDIDFFRRLYFDRIIGESTEECICIVIDNLDRVEAEDAISIIRILKTFIVDAKEDIGTKDQVAKKKLDKVVFVVPCCADTLCKHFEKVQRINVENVNGNGNGNDFLEKFFNVSFNIPAFREQDAFQYAKDLIRDMEFDFNEEHKSTIAHIISEGYGKNPRKAKIFLNKFLLYYNIARDCESAGKIEEDIITKQPECLAIYLAKQDNKNDYFNRLYQEKVSLECEAAIKYLKRPNDRDKIKGFEELFQLARRNEPDFFMKLSERANESQAIIDAIWNNISVGDYISQTNVIASIVSSIEKKPEIQISPYVAGKMARLLVHRYPQQLRNMPGKIVYERILWGKSSEIIGVLKNFGIQSVDGVLHSPEHNTYCSSIVGAVVDDIDVLEQKCQPHELPQLKEELQQVIERLVELGKEIVPIAIKYPKYTSNKVFDNALKMCRDGNTQIKPDDLLAYGLKLISERNVQEQTVFVNMAECFNFVLQSIPGVESEILNEYIEAFRQLSVYAHEKGINENHFIMTLNTMIKKFDSVSDETKLKIVATFRDSEKYNKWPNVRSNAGTHFNSKGAWLLQNGSEKATLDFIDQNEELIIQRLHGHIHEAAKRYKPVCYRLLSIYPDKRGHIISSLCKERKDWFILWIRENATKMSNEEKTKIQNVLFSVANDMGYPLEIYCALSHIKVGSFKDAISARARHFDTLINSKELSSLEGITFVLERIDKADYAATVEQNEKLIDGWHNIDQRTATKNLKQLANKRIRF